METVPPLTNLDQGRLAIDRAKAPSALAQQPRAQEMRDLLQHLDSIEKQSHPQKVGEVDTDFEDRRFECLDHFDRGETSTPPQSEGFDADGIHASFQTVFEDGGQAAPHVSGPA